MSEKLKICMVGAAAVGKTSLVTRFVSSVFQERYATTIGVKIQARQVRRGAHVVNLILWDLSGEDEFQSVQLSYLRGASGYLLVIDITREETLDTAVMLQERIREAIGNVPFIALLNKTDLVTSRAVDATRIRALQAKGWDIVPTSAKTGKGVDQAFERLVDAISQWRGFDGSLHRSP